ncbi:unnamed protein product [Paramecium primaurelia]|uniref:Uncharacterized protein n=1 Tax=Paramecium primaurelia TaxID=5886 RepID=A0A8S1LZQ0_PARPR|nr:unnamed protein product [Paramecium primaurelia]
MVIRNSNFSKLNQIILIQIMKKEKNYYKLHLQIIYVNLLLWKIQNMMIPILIMKSIQNIYVQQFNILQNYKEKRYYIQEQYQINKYFKQLQNQKYPDKQISRNKLHFRLTSDEMSYQLSGYQFNAITPFNMVQNMPLLISDKILNLEYIWFGGGHTDVKLRMDIKEMCTLYPNKVYYTDIIMPQQE